MHATRTRTYRRLAYELAASEGESRGGEKLSNNCKPRCVLGRCMAAPLAHAAFSRCLVHNTLSAVIYSHGEIPFELLLSNQKIHQRPLLSRGKQILYPSQPAAACPDWYYAASWAPAEARALPMRQPDSPPPQLAGSQVLPNLGADRMVQL